MCVCASPEPIGRHARARSLARSPRIARSLADVVQLVVRPTRSRSNDPYVPKPCRSALSFEKAAVEHCCLRTIAQRSRRLESLENSWDVARAVIRREPREARVRTLGGRMNGLRAILRLPLRSAGRNCQTAASEPTLVYTKELRFANDAFPRTIPTYRVLDDSNTEAQDCRIGDEQLVKMYESMVKLNVMDAVLYESQRQGRISFYMTNYGEEACQIGSAAALADEDPVYAQYRESGVLMWRGYDYQDFVDQCYGNAADPNKGRQMPVHYGSRRLNFLTISSPLGTQLPQAAGAAYALRLRGERRRLVACYFGEGAASEGDAHAALSFAATLRCPVLFFCRNNGYAISTPSGQQYAGDGVAAKGPAYGIPTLRVDGNDLLAVYNATGFAREFALSSQRPVLLEAMTYRLGHHSTSDDSSAYRPEREVQRRRELAPIARLSAYLAGRGLWDEQRQRRLAEASKRAVVAAVAEAERREKPHWRELFADVYARMPAHLASQMAKLDRHLREHADKYPTVGG